MPSVSVPIAPIGPGAPLDTASIIWLNCLTKALGPEHADTLASVHNLAIVLYGEGRYTEAERLDRETLDIRRGVLGPEHPDTLASRVT
jgi:hypothetical protein